MSSLRPYTIGDYWLAARRRKAAIILPVLVVLAASFAAIKRLENIYESSTLIVVDSPHGETGSSPGSLDLQRRLATIREQVISRTRLEGLIQKHGLYPEMTARSEPAERLVSAMRSDITVNPKSTRPDTTEAVVISYQSTDAEIAQRVTADLASQLIEDNVAALQSQVSAEVAVLRQRASEAQGQLRDMEQSAPALLYLKEDLAIVAPGGGQRQHESASAVATLKDQRYRLEQQDGDLVRRIDDQRRLIEQQKKAHGPNSHPAYGALVAKKAELQGLRHNYVSQQGLTDKHPRVAAVDDQVAAVDKAIADLNNQPAAATETPEQRDLKSLEAERRRVQIDLELSDRQIDRQAVSNAGSTGSPHRGFPRTANMARLAQDYMSLKRSYGEMIGKLRDMELKREAVGSVEPVQFRILDPANLPQVPSWPNRRLLALATAVLAIIAGLAGGVLAELRSISSLRNARDVEHYAKLPLLASIPKTETARERKVRERWKLAHVALGIAFSCLATFALEHVLTATHLFELIYKR